MFLARLIVPRHQECVVLVRKSAFASYDLSQTLKLASVSLENPAAGFSVSRGSTPAPTSAFRLSVIQNEDDDQIPLPKGSMGR